MANRKWEIANRNAATGIAARPHAARRSRVRRVARRVAGAIACALLCAVAASETSAQGNTAVITGAEHVFIRRGPGTEFPPFANLSQGATVEIQEMRGEWARVQTATGQSGYIRSTFLTLVGERSPAVLSARAVASTATPAAREVPTVSAPSTHPRTASTEQPWRQPQPPAQQGQVDTTPLATAAVPAATSELEKLHGDVARLTTTVEQLQQRLAADAPKENVPPVPTPSADAGSRVMTTTAILLTAIGLCVGWLLGNAYGRRHERGRRPRVRL
ncbi:MAG: SH3 domain-containing protein [Candidatus Binatia bacterium]